MKNGILNWDIKELSKAMKIKEEDVKSYFKDGRRVSFVIERRIAYEFLKGGLAPNEGTDYDVIDSEDKKWEVRSITKAGMYFCPSFMVGSGRVFDKKRFIDKLKRINGYIVADIESFPNVPFWVIPVELVFSWWKKGILGPTTKINRKLTIELIKSI